VIWPFSSPPAAATLGGMADIGGKARRAVLGVGAGMFLVFNLAVAAPAFGYSCVTDCGPGPCVTNCHCVTNCSPSTPPPGSPNTPSVPGGGGGTTTGGNTGPVVTPNNQQPTIVPPANPTNVVGETVNKTSPTALPFTGTDVVGLVAIALGLIAAGIAGRRLGRRRLAV